MDPKMFIRTSDIWTCLRYFPGPTQNDYVYSPHEAEVEKYAIQNIQYVNKKNT